MLDEMTERQRIERTLLGEPCDKIPWATRLDIWHAAATRSGSLPEPFMDMDLMDIHRSLGIGRQAYAVASLMHLHGVDVSVTFNGRLIRKESSPMMNFPLPREYVPPLDPGDTRIVFETPAGRSFIRFRTTELSIREAGMAYLVDHLLKDDSDYAVIKWILAHAEPVLFTKSFERTESLIGEDGFTIPVLGRTPFQHIMLDYMGEEHTIYTLADSPAKIDYLLGALEEHAHHILELGLTLPSPMVEFTDNYEGMVTSPSLFRRFCMPFLQAAADKVHAVGKVLGSHMDGNMKPLVHLIPESGIDVVESFSPAPLTRLTFTEAWKIWQGKVLMWGVIPSPIFEPHVSGEDFENWLKGMLETLDGDNRIILGIGDQALGPTLTDRIKQVSELLGRTPM